MLQSTPAGAIPVFARIYDKPCGTCHTVFPQLNPAGENFRAHGFHGLPAAVKPLHAGSLEVPGTLPLALYFTVGEDVSQERSGATRTHFDVDAFSLLAGGELGSRLAFLVDYELVETEPDTGDVTIHSLPEQAYLQAHAEPAGWLGNLRLGWFELPLGVSPRVHRLSAAPYLTYGLTACRLLGSAPPGVACDDVAVLDEAQIGVELGGLAPATGFGWVLGATNGSNNRLDDSASRDFYARVSQPIGLHRIGLFVFYSPDLLGAGSRDRTLRVGPDVSWYNRRLRVLAQFLANHESNPTGHSEGLWYYGGFVEGEYRFTTWLLGLVRTEYAWTPRFDDRSEGGETDVRRRLWSVTGGGQWLLLQNFKLVAEVTFQEDRETVSNANDHSWFGTIRAVSAFWALDPLLGFSAWRREATR